MYITNKVTFNYIPLNTAVVLAHRMGELPNQEFQEVLESLEKSKQQIDEFYVKVMMENVEKSLNSLDLKYAVTQSKLTSLPKVLQSPINKKLKFKKPTKARARVRKFDKGE